MDKKKPEVQLDRLIRANYPVIVVNSYEEARVGKAVRAVANAQVFQSKDGGKKPKSVYEWTVSDGLRRVGAEDVSPDGVPAPEDTRLPTVALGALKTWQGVTKDATIFVFKDLHAYLQDAEVVRCLRDLVGLFQSQPNTLILLSPEFPLPPEMAKDVSVLDWPLPSEDELSKILERAEKKLPKGVKSDLGDATREAVVQSLRGLSEFEAASVLSMAIVTNLALDAQAIPLILSEKKAIIKKSGFLEYVEAEVGVDEVGGLDELKSYAARKLDAFSKEAEAYGLDRPNGVMVYGVPGAGKSLLIKALSRARARQIAILRLDLAALKGGLVGQTETNTLQALRVIDAFGECIVWLDEVEKALGDVTGRSLDGGASLGQFGILLTWMQERKYKGSAAYLAATANGIRGLPPEFLRRFDDVFFVDLPTQSEREEILTIHLNKRRRDPKQFRRGGP